MISKEPYGTLFVKQGVSPLTVRGTPETNFDELLLSLSQAAAVK